MSKRTNPAENDRLYAEARRLVDGGMKVKDAIEQVGMTQSAWHQRNTNKKSLPVPVPGKRRRHSGESQPRLVTLPTTHETPALSDGGQVTAMIVKVPVSFIMGLFE